MHGKLTDIDRMTGATVLLDSDFHTLADDHEALAMVAWGHRRGSLRLAAITVVTGNTWAGISASEARRALRVFGLDDEVIVREGARQPLLHRQSDFEHRSRMHGAAYGGAWDASPVFPHEGHAQTGVPRRVSVDDHAVTFMVDLVLRNETPVTIVAIGPMTNFALALRLCPEISQNIGRVVCMGGAFYVPGNVTPSAEFNWWFDAEAARIVLESGLKLEIVPLDATDGLVLDAARYGNWSDRFGTHSFFRRFHRSKFAQILRDDPKFELPVWDAVTTAYLIDPDIATVTEDLWATVDCVEGPSYGRVVAYRNAGDFNLPAPERPPARVILRIDAERFWDLYETSIFDPVTAAG